MQVSAISVFIYYFIFAQKYEFTYPQENLNPDNPNGFNSSQGNLGDFTGCIDETMPGEFFNEVLDCMDSSSSNPPSTDNGAQPPFKYPFSYAHKGFYTGGWTRQVTVRDLPISTKMAGVQMRLISGGVREMHWHVSSEWAYVLWGNIRITAIDDKGRSSVNDVSAGDLWLFPGGFPHSIQGIGEHGGMFLLVFKDGNFNEFGTFLLTDWMNHVPKEVLAKNFEVPISTFSNLPLPQRYMFASELPRPLEEEQEEASEVTGEVPLSFAFFTSLIKPNISRTGGNVKIVDRNNFPITDIAAAIVTLKPGALRELHWHPNADEWQYYVKGSARMGVFAAGGEARTMDFHAGDVGYIQQSTPHYVENTGDDDLLFLEIFPAEYYSDVSLAEWLAHTPSRLVNEHLDEGEQFINTIQKTEAVIVPW